MSHIKTFQFANDPCYITRFGGGGGKYSSVFLFGFCHPPEAAVTTKSAPLSASIVTVISLFGLPVEVSAGCVEAGARLDN